MKNLRLYISSALSMPLLFISITTLAQASQGIINLESQIQGNQEQPNVLSIVPWKEASDFRRIDQGVEADISRLFQHLDEEEFSRQQYFFNQFQSSEMALED